MPASRSDSRLQDYLWLLLTAACWAPSFLFIKVAINGGMPPASVATFRVFLATGAMLLLLRARGLRLPRDRATWLLMLPMGCFATALPFILFSWGEVHADSGLASILNGTVPIFTVLLANLFLADERLNLPKVAGLVLGFAGIALTFSPKIGGAASADGADPMALWGLGAFLIAAACYGATTVYARRRLMGLPPLLAPTMQLVIASAVMLPVTWWLEWPLKAAPSTAAWASVAFLALVGTAAAYFAFYTVIARTGATFASLVTYLLPPVGIALGVIVLGEVVGWQEIVGCGLIIAGVAVVSSRVASRS